MEIIKARAAFLSNYEVYSLLQEMEAKQLEQTRAIMATKKEENSEDLYKGPNYVVPEEVSENVRTIQVELLQYLNNENLPTARQSEEAVAHLTRGLRKYQLTKAEKLQIVNLCPQSVLELYVIVEEMESRFENDVDDILKLVQEKLAERSKNTQEAEETYLADVVDAEEEQDIWGGEGPSQYLEEEFEEGADDFEPMLDIDEAREPQD
ncbi:SubName: Full=Uncharacterized protein {ECO:0000313/EMBL:CCA67618.1} [Serendipita indica DSM 11827]|uniref:DNA-directed RNA polymerase III subunit RPC9 n=1 Tax=Serendipita indica (strain DSM 11827) TaxID=1109443 RepID=G4T8H5_SERID|nr:SubName: Full=Uncharacterized protein {ECO:0000313/EMBL:CCA67618.1} [Serendipita indica DSM 11827]CCA67618.1 hypothetical protein PIIN_01446 [Serendipita indica DSM 11827]